MYSNHLNTKKSGIQVFGIQIVTVLVVYFIKYYILQHKKTEKLDDLNN